MPKRRILFILTCVGLLVMLWCLDKYWAPLDEGIMTVGAERILAGEMPYRDIFVVMYPPGQLYVLALLYKIFGVSLGIGRLYAALIQTGIAISVFLITDLLTVRPKGTRRAVPLLAYIIALTCLAPRMGALPTPIWPGMALSLWALYFFMRYCKGTADRGLTADFVYTWLFASSAIMFRHDIGIFLCGALILGLFLKRERFIRIIYAGLIILSIPFFFGIYLYLQKAMPDLIASLFLFPFVHEKTACLPFPRPCLDLRMIFHGSLAFINNNQYYIPVAAYAVALIAAVSSWIRARKLEWAELGIIVTAVFGIGIFNQVRIRPDPAHLLTIIFPSIILFAYLLPKRGWIRIGTALIAFLFVLLAIKNIDKGFKNVIRKPLRGDVVLTKFSRGSLYIPKDEQKDVVSCVKFIEGHTAPGERIYFGNRPHSVDAFGGSLVIHTLCGRLPSEKYYELLPGLVTDAGVQAEIVRSLDRHRVRYLVLQDVDVSGSIEKKDAGLLDTFIQEHFAASAAFGKYHIYERK
ncbi:MAG: hypothetical protein PHS37_01760 [Candidatus Omnitrophica bacterium]|nr:hypothetical protein [Candidatus Omnitrophota bacterium]